MNLEMCTFKNPEENWKTWKSFEKQVATLIKGCR